MAVTTTRVEINEFLAQKRLAVIGVSRDSDDFTYRLFHEFKQRGYNVIPVNPHAEAVEGERCFARVQDIAPEVEGALLLTSPAVNEQVVRDCAAAGVKRVWMYGVGDRSAENERAIAFCKEHGIAVIPGFCPFMYLPGTPFFHQAHGFVMRLFGQCPN
jgi:uncharacterized protein